MTTNRLTRQRPLLKAFRLRRPCWRALRGQNLVETVLCLPMVIVVIFAVIEVARVWQAYMGAKLAALDGAVTASQYQSAGMGLFQIGRRLSKAGLEVGHMAVFEIPNLNGSGAGTDHPYQARVIVLFRPIFAGLSIPGPGGPFRIIPNMVPIRYESVRYYSML
jgi:hypothetical protein